MWMRIWNRSEADGGDGAGILLGDERERKMTRANDRAELLLGALLRPRWGICILTAVHIHFTDQERAEKKGVL